MGDRKKQKHPPPPGTTPPSEISPAAHAQARSSALHHDLSPRHAGYAGPSRSSDDLGRIALGRQFLSLIREKTINVFHGHPGIILPMDPVVQEQINRYPELQDEWKDIIPFYHEAMRVSRGWSTSPTMISPAARAQAPVNAAGPKRSPVDRRIIAVSSDHIKNLQKRCTQVMSDPAGVRFVPIVPAIQKKIDLYPELQTQWRAVAPLYHEAMMRSGRSRIVGMIGLYLIRMRATYTQIMSNPGIGFRPLDPYVQEEINNFPELKAEWIQLSSLCHAAEKRSKEHLTAIAKTSDRHVAAPAMPPANVATQAHSESTSGSMEPPATLLTPQPELRKRKSTYKEKAPLLDLAGKKLKMAVTTHDNISTKVQDQSGSSTSSVEAQLIPLQSASREAQAQSGTTENTVPQDVPPATTLASSPSHNDWDWDAETEKLIYEERMKREMNETGINAKQEESLTDSPVLKHDD